MPPPLWDCLRRCFELDCELRPVMAELLDRCNSSASWLNAELPLVSKSAKASSSHEDLVDSLYTIACVLLATKDRRNDAIDVLKEVIALEPTHPGAKTKLETLSTETTEAQEDDTPVWHQRSAGPEGMTEAEIEEWAVHFKTKFDGVIRERNHVHTLGGGRQSDWPMMSENSTLRHKYIDHFIEILKELRRRYPSYFQRGERVCESPRPNRASRSTLNGVCCVRTAPGDVEAGRADRALRHGRHR